ncbi:MAG: hypothetical protein ACETWG_01020, partial [Candidatus Neomarinimicrobiota bacterium]
IMIGQRCSHVRWAWLGTITAAVGLVLTLSRCEQKLIIAPLPGSQWTLEPEVIDSMVVRPLYRTPYHGNSLTLYAGFTDARESGILIKFASVDTSRFDSLKAARLVLIRRTVADELPEPSASFKLSVIDEPDTAWTESDTGLTLSEFPNLILPKISSLVVGTVTVGLRYQASDSVMEHLAFPVDSLLLLQWAAGVRANNGFLIRQENQGRMAGFYSWSSDNFPPYLALLFKDTTSTGGDTVVTQYYLPAGDLSIYPTADFVPGLDDGSAHLDYSNGIRTLIDFDPYLDVDTTSMVAGARLVLRVNEEASELFAERMDLRVLRRARPEAEGDSLVILIERLTYSTESDSLILKLGSFVSALAIGAIDNYGLDLVVLPINYDFDHLVFWGLEAPSESLKPRLEIMYSRPYVEAPL